MIGACSEWDEGRETAFQQSTPYAVAAAAMGARVGRRVVDGAQVQWLDRRGLRMIARTGLEAAALRGLARHWGATVAVPETGVAGFGLVPLVTAQHLALWDLTRDVADLRAGLAAKWRNRLAAAEGRVRVSRGRAGCMAALLAHEAAMRRARGYRALPAEFTRAVPGAALRLWEWRTGGQVAAAMCFVRHGGWASYHMGWAADAARSQGVHGVMLWQAACSLRAEGVGTLDLGLVDHGAAPGLAHFKLGTGARLHALGAAMLVLPG